MLLVVMMIITLLPMAAFAEETTPVARVGSEEFTDIDAAIEAWTVNNQSTLTLLANVTVTKTVNFTFNRSAGDCGATLNLGSYVWNAVGCDAFYIDCAGADLINNNGGLNINAVAGGGIAADSSHSIIACKSWSSDYRPLITINGGTYTAKHIFIYGPDSTSYWSNNPSKKGPGIQTYAGSDGSAPVFNGDFHAPKCKLQLYAGVFNGTIYAYPVTSTQYTDVYTGVKLSNLVKVSNDKGINYKGYLYYDGSYWYVQSAKPDTYDVKVAASSVKVGSYAVTNNSGYTNADGYVYFSDFSYAFANYAAVILAGIEITDDAATSSTRTIDASAVGANYTGNITLTSSSAKLKIIGQEAIVALSDSVLVLYKLNEEYSEADNSYTYSAVIDETKLGAEVLNKYNNSTPYADADAGIAAAAEGYTVKLYKSSAADKVVTCTNPGTVLTVMLINDGAAYTGNVTTSTYGYTLEKNVNGNTITYVASVDHTTAQAKIGDTYYATLDKAISAANTGDTIVLNTDVSGSRSYSVNKSITIDLNGKVLDVASGSSGALYASGSSAKLVVKDSVGTGAIKNSATPYNGNYYGLGAYNGASIVLDNVNVETKGTLFDIYAKTDYVAASSVTVNGGSYVGTLSCGDGSTLAITGGTFSVDPSEYVDSEFYAVDKIGDVWAVRGKDFSIAPTPTFGEAKNEVVEEAAEKASDGTDIPDGKKEIVKDAAETAVDQINDNTRTSNVETNVEKAVKTDESAIISKANQQADDNPFTDENATVDTTVTVKLENVKVDANSVQTATEATNITVNTATYDVNPVATVTTTIEREGQAPEVKVEEVVLTNEDLNGKPVTVRLGVPATAATMAKITHTSADFPEEVFYAPVQGTAPNQFVEIEITHFSKIEVQVLDGVVSNPVAAIGSTGYATLADAFAAVPANGTETTIVLLKDANISFDTATYVNVASNQNAVLDLNGYKVTSGTNFANSSQLFLNDGTLVIQDSAGGGSITHGANPAWIYDGSGNYAGSYASNLITNRGTLTVKGGTLENVSTGSAAYVVDNNSTVSSPVFNMEGGSLKAAKTAVRGYLNSTVNDNTINISAGEIYSAGGYGIMFQSPNDNKNKGDLTITGGTLTSESTTYPLAMYAYATAGSDTSAINVSITGGEFEGNIALSGGMDKAEVEVGGSVVANDAYSFGEKKFISGGTFANNVNDFCVEDYEAKYNEETGTYGVDEMPDVAEVNGVKYKTLAKAIAAVPADGTETTVTLLSNIELVGNVGVVIPAGKNVVLELNGKTINGTVTESKESYVIRNYGTLTVQDSAGGGVIKNSCTTPQPGDWPNYNYTTNVIDNNGTVIIKSGTIENTANGAICYAVDNSAPDGYNPVLKLEGGTLKQMNYTPVRVWGTDSNSSEFYMTGGTIEGLYGVAVNFGNGSAPKVKVEISDGAVVAASYALYSSGTDNITNYDNASLKVTGGTFGNGAVPEDEELISVSGFEGFITGGTFTEDVDISCEDDYYCIGDGPFQVVKIAPIADATYTGNKITPAVVVTVGEKTLAAGTDYTVEYSDNVNAGTATATVKFKGDYSGETTLTFTINKVTVNNVSVSCPTVIDGNAPAPVVTADIGKDTAAFLYSKDGTTWDTWENTYDGMGDYQVQATIEETNNYVGGTATASFKVDDTSCVTYKVVQFSALASGTYNMFIGSVNTGEYKYEMVVGGYTIQSTATGQYVAFSDGSIVMSSEPFTWAKGDYEFHTSVIVTSRYWLFGWRTKTEVTTYYLVCDANGKLAASTAAAVTHFTVPVVTAYHTYKYFSNGDGTHCYKCAECGRVAIASEACQYENGKCILCGATDPSAQGVINVTVTPKKLSTAEKILAIFFPKSVAQYGGTISATTLSGVSVQSVKYNIDGAGWNSGSSFESKTAFKQVQIQITDSRGGVTCWVYDGSTVTQVPSF